MRRRTFQLAAVLGVAAFAAPATQASPAMCVARQRCGITHVQAPPLARRAQGSIVLIVPTRADGSQHGRAGAAH
jgi:hypothetical protein